jgi:anti-sigma B factor antagonist/stage II sporulation protein AA (anti-sigma F factor antagonist)
MQFSEETKGDIHFLRISGRIDAITSPQLEKKVQSLLESGVRKLALDFFNVDYLSSAGMRFLLSSTKKLKSLNGKLVLFSVDEDVLEIIKMAGFHTILSLASNEEKAKAEFN